LGFRGEAEGGFASSLACSLVAAVIGLSLYVYSVAPGGTVKMHIAFSAWIGATRPLWNSVLVTLVITATVLAVVGFAYAVALRMHGERQAVNDAFGECTPAGEFPIQQLASLAAIAGVSVTPALGLW
jgi:Flp pilus assembly protein protease CpaA